MSARTGIEISLDWSKGMQAVSKVFQALHLDQVVAELLKNTRTLVVILDGERHELAVFEKHFLPCSPGTHHLELAFAAIPVNLQITEVITHRSAEIPVEPGHVTEVHFRQSLGPSSYEIVLIGTHADAAPT